MISVDFDEFYVCLLEEEDGWLVEEVCVLEEKVGRLEGGNCDLLVMSIDGSHCLDAGGFGSGYCFVSVRCLAKK